MSITKFIEVTIDGQLHSISIDNIALIKQIDANVTEIHLLSKTDNNPVKFKVAYNYMNFKMLLDGEDRFGINFTLNELK